jgi:hypothetical protein
MRFGFLAIILALSIPQGAFSAYRENPDYHYLFRARGKARDRLIQAMGRPAYLERLLEVYYPELDAAGRAEISEATREALLRLDHGGLTRPRIRLLLGEVARVPDFAKMALARHLSLNPDALDGRAGDKFRSDLESCKGDSGCLLHRILRLVKGDRVQDLAREIELAITPGILSLLTTHDGTIGAAMPADMPAPPALLKWAKREGVPVEEIRAAPWDKLRYETKLAVLSEAPKFLTHSFSQSRKAYGLRIREKADVPVAMARALGVTVPPGAVVWQIEPHEIFTDQVEYMNVFRTGKELELHMRSRDLRPSELDARANALLEAAGSVGFSQHTHFPARLRGASHDSELIAARRAEYGYRVSLAGELIELVEGKRSIVDRSGEGGTYHRPMERGDVMSGFKHLLAAHQGSAILALGKGADGFARIRGIDTYDGPEPLWGIEYRGRPNVAPELTARLLDAIQFSVETSSFGISESRFRKWLPEGMSPEYRLEPLSYQQDWTTLLKKMPSIGRNELYQIRDRTRLEPADFVRKYQHSEDTGKTSKLSTELKLLFHDWSSHPLFHRDENAIEVLQKAQARALRAIGEGEDVAASCARFAVESGLYDRVLASLGVSR